MTDIACCKNTSMAMLCHALPAAPISVVSQGVLDNAPGVRIEKEVIEPAVTDGDARRYARALKRSGVIDAVVPMTEGAVVSAANTCIEGCYHNRQPL